MFKKILLVSSIECGLVMLAELCAAKLIAPYFGTSIQVWAATLSVILGGLAAGYLIGSRRSKFGYERNIKDLKIIFLFKPKNLKKNYKKVHLLVIICLILGY